MKVFTIDFTKKSAETCGNLVNAWDYARSHCEMDPRYRKPVAAIFSHPPL